eukprot:3236786-Rhodomonas_salina.1
MASQMNVIRMMAVKRQFRDDFATHKITPEEVCDRLSHTTTLFFVHSPLFLTNSDGGVAQ